jgi:hypothetical protein
MRARISVPPPTGKLTTIVIGLLGNWLIGSCAWDREVIREVSIHKADAIIIFLLNQ